jgi:hypothetical protein
MSVVIFIISGKAIILYAQMISQAWLLSVKYRAETFLNLIVRFVVKKKDNLYLSRPLWHLQAPQRHSNQ